MANMSYCRWENTSRDMEDCIANMEETQEHGFEFSSDHELRGFHRVLRCAAELLEYATPEQLAAAGVDLARLA